MPIIKVNGALVFFSLSFDFERRWKFASLIYLAEHAASGYILATQFAKLRVIHKRLACLNAWLVSVLSHQPLSFAN